MNKSCEVSVIIPVYNCEEYLKKCIDSVIGQSFKNFEIILVNDGSTDNSGVICDEYAKNDERVNVIHQENQGVSAARKKGIEVCNSQYITFIDSDDYIKNDYLEVMLKEIKKSNSDFVCCNSIDIGDNLPNNKKNKDNKLITDKQALILDYFNRKRYCFCIWGKIFNKDILEKIVFPKMKYSEDTYMILNLFSICRKVHLLAYEGYYYVERSVSSTFLNNLMQKANDTLIRSKFLNEICQKIDNYDLMHKAKREMTQAVYWAVIANCTYANKEEFERFLEQFDECYKYCLNTRDIRYFIIKIFKFNNKLTKFVIKPLYLLKNGK